jgi:hypothetical protein
MSTQVSLSSCILVLAMIQRDWLVVKHNKKDKDYEIYCDQTRSQ